MELTGFIAGYVAATVVTTFLMVADEIPVLPTADFLKLFGQALFQVCFWPLKI